MPYANLTFEGNVGAEPTTRTTANGNTEVRISVGHSAGRMVNGSWEDHGTVWINVYAYGAQATTLVNTLHKGDRVLVSGTFSHSDYMDKSGAPRTEFRVMANSVALVPKNNPQQSMSSGQAQAWAGQQQSNWGSQTPTQAPQSAPVVQSQYAQPQVDPWSAGTATSFGGSDEFGGDNITF